MPTPGPKLNHNQKSGDLGCLTRTLKAEVEWGEKTAVCLTLTLVTYKKEGKSEMLRLLGSPGPHSHAAPSRQRGSQACHARSGQPT